MGRRNQSNVPAQALILMNDPFVHEMAKQWAEAELRHDVRTLDEHLESMYEAAFARLPTQTERTAARTFLFQQSGLEIDAQGDENDRDLTDQLSPQAWADLAHVLFNVKEFIYLK
jgi:hypothetical protein